MQLVLSKSSHKKFVEMNNISLTVISGPYMRTSAAMSTQRQWHSIL